MEHEGYAHPQAIIRTPIHRLSLLHGELAIIPLHESGEVRGAWVRSLQVCDRADIAPLRNERIEVYTAPSRLRSQLRA